MRGGAMSCPIWQLRSRRAARLLVYWSLTSWAIQVAKWLIIRIRHESLQDIKVWNKYKNASRQKRLIYLPRWDIKDRNKIKVKTRERKKQKSNKHIQAFCEQRKTFWKRSSRWPDSMQVPFSPNYSHSINFLPLEIIAGYNTEQILPSY